MENLLTLTNTQILLTYLTYAITALSVAHLLLVTLEGALEIWIPRESSPRLWGFLDKLGKTVAYLSLALQRKPKE